ncbi:hypothetical protein Ae707Ps1_3615c [Pseudonocardia sp. Ae707_Ps1]|jgi:hypothetical protein|nr:hypothetical protein Ae707Ps1_3615c [Pseudonocardia sp. Ae707_Ps1]
MILPRAAVPTTAARGESGPAVQRDTGHIGRVDGHR